MIKSDLPITNIKDDLLNRTSLADNLAKTVLDLDAPQGFVIGIYGKWGCGKTSFINMFLDKVCEHSSNLNERHVVIRFEPWLCSDSKQLIYQFFKQLSSAIKMKEPGLKNVCKFINKYADVLDISEYLPVVKVLYKPAWKALKNISEKQAEEHDDLQYIKNNISETLRREKIKIIVTIDDIDRLSNEEIVSVFQLVKSLADFPNTVYILSFDRDIVVRALRSVQKGDGFEYLEKIVQAPFELPPASSEEIQQVLFKILSSIIETSDKNWDEEYWNEMFNFGIEPYLNTIRDVIRFTNTFELKYALLKDETYPIDLLGLTCLQVFEPQIFSRLPLQKEILCGVHINKKNTAEETTEKRIQNAYDFIFTGIIKRRAEKGRNILAQLFPQLGSFLSPSMLEANIRHYNHDEALRKGYISCEKCFDRYFSLTLEETAISRQIVDHLLFKATAEELTEGILEISSSNRINSFLDQINANFSLKNDLSIKTGRADLILQCLLLCWHKLNDDYYYKEYFSVSLPIYLDRIVHNLLHFIKESLQYNFLYHIFNLPKMDISTIFLVMTYLEKNYNRFTENRDPSKEKPIEKFKFEELERTFIKRTVEELESGNLLNNDYAVNIILLFEQIAPDEAKLYTNRIIDSELSLAKLISSAVEKGKTTDTLSCNKVWIIREHKIKKYIDISEAYKRIRTFVHTDEFCHLTDCKKENIAAFLITMEYLDEKGLVEHDITISDIKKKLEELGDKNKTPVLI